MEPAQLWSALRYVEQNPVCAGIVPHAGDYPWSSAAAHLCGKDKSHILDMDFWSAGDGAEHWRDLLNCSPDSEAPTELRRATYAGRPFGSNDFIENTTSAIPAAKPAHRAPILTATL